MTIYWGPNQEFVEALLNSDTRFFIRGGVAVNYYDATREVGDLDLLIEPSRETAEKVRDVFSRFAQPLFTVDDLARPAVGFRDRTVLNVDVLTARSVMDFGEHWEDAEQATFRGKVIRVASIKSLLRLDPRPDDVVRLQRAALSASAPAYSCSDACSP